MNKDQKSLEFLYENIVENKEPLLEEEREYIDAASKQIVQQLYKGIASYVKLAPREPLYNFISSEQLHFDKEPFKKFFSNVDYEDHKVIIHIFEDVILKNLVEFLVYVVTKENRIYISFRHFVDFVRMFNNPFEVPYENTQEVLKMFKNVLSHAIIFLYSKPAPAATTDRWKMWRERRMKFERLEKKLPELEGVFS
jgi:hypothetical protein